MVSELKADSIFESDARLRSRVRRTLCRGKTDAHFVASTQSPAVGKVLVTIDERRS